MVKQALIVNRAAALTDEELLEATEIALKNALQDTGDKGYVATKSSYEASIKLVDRFIVNDEQALDALYEKLSRDGLPNSQERRRGKLAVCAIGPALEGVVDVLTQGLEKT